MSLCKYILKTLKFFETVLVADNALNFTVNFNKDFFLFFFNELEKYKECFEKEIYTENDIYNFMYIIYNFKTSINSNLSQILKSESDVHLFKILYVELLHIEDCLTLIHCLNKDRKKYLSEINVLELDLLYEFNHIYTLEYDKTKKISDYMFDSFIENSLPYLNQHLNAFEVRFVFKKINDDIDHVIFFLLSREDNLFDIY
jgi:hypothetical protein